MTDFERIVIVGAGVGGLRAAERLREMDYDGELVIIGDEPRWPYHRPLVSKNLLAGTDRAADLTLQRYVDTGARWRLGTRAERLETQRKVVHLPGGEEIKYDGLIIATGVEPRHLKGVPRHSPRVHTMRTVDEAMAAKRTIQECDLPIVVLGTGYIGCDVAASARKMGRDVTMVGRSKFPLRNLGNEVASAVDTLHRKHHARMAMGTDIRNWVVSDDSIAMHTTDGQLLVAGCVIMAVGSIPAVEWMRGSGLVLEDGVLCDATLFAAGAEDVVAVGDCARFPNLRYDDTPRRIEHWINAVEMGRHAAENLLLGREKATPFTPIPRVWSGQYDVRLQIAGVPSLGKDTVHLADGTPGTPGVTGYVRDGKLVGVCGWDTPRAMIKWTEELHKLLPVPETPAKRPVAPAPKAAPAVQQRPSIPALGMAPPVPMSEMPTQVPAMAALQSAPQAAPNTAPFSMPVARPAMPSGPYQRPMMPAAAVNRPVQHSRPMPSMPMATPSMRAMAPVQRPPMNSMPMSAPPMSTPSMRAMSPVPRPSEPRTPMPPPMNSGPWHSGQMPRPDMAVTEMMPAITSEPSMPETSAIPNLSAPNLSLSNLSVPNIPVPDTPAAAMRPAPPPARQRRADRRIDRERRVERERRSERAPMDLDQMDSSERMPLPPMPPIPPSQHPSFPNMRPVARPAADAPRMEHPSFPSMRPVQRPPMPMMEHPSFPSMQPVARPDAREDVRLPVGRATRGFG
ncbi:NADPH-dependent 2,4-dienoyl-CoA reductase/sulfur reductase-like enzyme [Kibdelosporangium banguiense]|uniref:NADPH-dependent 2,4-dienoyl-CoA reductase/sulfur reductase-like enzyme n=1 Tax=Kibdelosporangium banguiense TaxID=1365924 RepID=A0ABS4T6Z6_9PSEU|nr:FAD/NAD(P)-binding oxidoreductase [Kibdelosporangium banguiense]MBP2320192.1 NADPH-dependent 2,4-dienoyl-CoA reductase/sulfur reductase-like enzyme [Kibdelosporangium banguiense]